MQKGGILIISKDDANIYNKLQIALTQGKPVLWYETPTECYYIDTISGGEITTEIVDDEEVTSYGDIILTKGGKTITITSANAVSESGSIIANRIEDIVDSAGNKRFIEGALSTSTITGISFNYGKWSLSGSHLMIVLAGVVEENAVISNSSWAILSNFPQWIFDKIVPIFSVVVEFKTQYFYANDYTNQSMTISLYKDVDGYIKLVRTGGGSTTFTKERNFRIQFDLLIDTDDSE